MNDRRRHGEGNITERNGRFLVRIWREDGRRKSLGTYPTQEEAERTLSAALAKLAERNAVLPGGVTVETFGLRVLDARELAGVRGIATERSRWRAHMTGTVLGSIPVSSVTGPDVRAWVDELLRTRATDMTAKKNPRFISSATVRRCLALLSVVLEDAIGRGLATTNFARGQRVQKRGGAIQKWTYLTQVEQQAITSCEKIPEPDRLRILFAMGTGLRQGEQWNLHLADLKVDGTSPHVIVRFGSKGKAPKSGKTRRVPLFGTALEATRRWIEILPTYAKKNPQKLMWPTLRGARRQPSKTYGFKAHLTAAGIKRSVRWHDLRHTCASSLVAGWWGTPWRLDLVRDLLGHSSVTVTEVYAHLAPGVLQAAADGTDGSVVWDQIGITSEEPVDESPMISAARPARFELATCGFEVRCSIQLS
jgi:integrase